MKILGEVALHILKRRLRDGQVSETPSREPRQLYRRNAYLVNDRRSPFADTGINGRNPHCRARDGAVDTGGHDHPGILAVKVQQLFRIFEPRSGRQMTRNLVAEPQRPLFL
jgi:hypothetical protein